MCLVKGSMCDRGSRRGADIVTWLLFCNVRVACKRVTDELVLCEWNRRSVKYGTGCRQEELRLHTSLLLANGRRSKGAD